MYSITHKVRLPPLHSVVVWSLTNSSAWVKFIYIEWLEFKTTSNCIVNTCCGISYSLAFLVCSEILTTVTRVQTRFREFPRQLLVWNEEIWSPPSLTQICIIAHVLSKHFCCFCIKNAEPRTRSSACWEGEKTVFLVLPYLYRVSADPS